MPCTLRCALLPPTAPLCRVLPPLAPADAAPGMPDPGLARPVLPRLHLTPTLPDRRCPSHARLRTRLAPARPWISRRRGPRSSTSSRRRPHLGPTVPATAPLLCWCPTRLPPPSPHTSSAMAATPPNSDSATALSSKVPPLPPSLSYRLEKMVSVSSSS
jgi:hypothetical protein